MRGIEKGQQADVVIVDQVAKLIEKDLANHGVWLPREQLENLEMQTIIMWLLTWFVTARQLACLCAST